MSTATETRLFGLEKLKGEIAANLEITKVAEILGADLIPSGGQMKCLCLLHDERTPSMQLNPTKGAGGVFFCFGCGRGGDSIDLIQQVRNLSFPEAVEQLATEAGIELAKYQRPMTDEEKRAAELQGECEGWLNGSPLSTERCSMETAKALGIRHSKTAQTGWPGIQDFQTKGTIFPMRTPAGKLVGWKARQPNKKMYATTQEFPLHKPTLFGIDVARQFVRDEIVLVEGEWDAAVCHDHGFRNVVAVGGTHLTDAHMQMMADLKIHQITLCFDGGEAGKTASRRYAEKYWRHDIPVHIADLPDDKDPEDVLTSGDFGQVEFGTAIAGAKLSLEWLLWDRWQDAGMGGTLTKRLAFIEQVRKDFGSKLRPDEEMLVMTELADWLDLPDAEVLDLVRSSPNSLVAPDSERVVIARCLVDQGYFRDVRKRLDRDDFHILQHRRVWEILSEMLAQGFDFDLPTVKSQAQAKGVNAEMLQDLAAVATVSNQSYHEDQILDLATRRQARNDADRFRERIGDVSLDSKIAIGDLTEAVTLKALGGPGAPRSISEHVDEAMETLHERMRNPNAVHGLDLGSQWPTFMSNLQGIQSRRFLLIAAASTVGKTTMGVQWATSLALQSIPVDFVSLEVDPGDLLYKMASHMTGVNLLAISGGRLDDREAKLVEKAMMRLRKSPLQLYAPDGITPSEFQLYCRESVMEHRTEVFFLDYAQMVAPDSGFERESKYEQLGHFGKVCKHKIARGMGVSVVCMAQLGRQAAEKERPSMNDMGDSYNLVRDSDVIMVLKSYGEDEPETIDMWLEKNRQGRGCLLIPVRFDALTQTFHERTAPSVPDYRLS